MANGDMVKMVIDLMCEDINDIQKSQIGIENNLHMLSRQSKDMLIQIIHGFTDERKLFCGLLTVSSDILKKSLSE